MTSDSSSLEAFIASMGGERQLRVEENLGAGFVRLRVAEAERRQAKHDIRCVEDAVIELLRNSRDAGARRIFVATTREGDLRTTTILDDGSGIPQEMHERVFDARVTSKLESMRMDRWGVHGRGMALYSVRENAESIRVMSSDAGLGCSIKMVTDASKLAERADQSTWPRIGVDDDGTQSIVRGPHNIIRACCEFALDEAGVCEVYLGSPAEIVSSVRMHVRPSITGAELLFIDALEELPVLDRLSVAADASELLRVASSLGLEMSERTAHRIVSGEIRPLRSIYSRLTHKMPASKDREIDLTRDSRKLRITEQDIKEFSRIMERDFSFLAQRYYLSLSDDPIIRYTNGKITVTFAVEEDD